MQWAGLLLVIFFIAHLAGLRDFTSVLNGTIGSTSMDWNTAAFLGVAYVLIYLGVVLMVPILALAALILTLWNKMLSTKGAADESRNEAQKN
jgi:flagellar biosynthesis/type III secretory pathway M-ring protein FliF/YscJ